MENSPLHVFPLQKKQLTVKNLFASASDPDRMIYFKIIKAPLLGHILIKSKDKIFQATTSFSQLEVNEGRIYYEHTHPFEDLYVEDSFIFNVESHLAESLNNQVVTNFEFKIKSFIDLFPEIQDRHFGLFRWFRRLH